MYPGLKLKVLQEEFSYVLLRTPDEILRRLSQSDIKSPTALFCAPDEVSAILPATIKIECITSEPDWSCIRIIGDMPFGMSFSANSTRFMLGNYTAIKYKIWNRMARRGCANYIVNVGPSLR